MRLEQKPNKPLLRRIIMRKVLSVLLVVSMLLIGAAAFADETYEIALVTDVGNIDDQSFNQSAWEGVVAFAEAGGYSYAYFRPTEDSTEARVESIKSAIEKGAKVMVCPGYLFEEAIYDLQDQYPDVNFLLIDGEPHSVDYADYRTASNVHNILYREEQAGYLAGYAAVMDGYTKLGFLGGMAVPAVVRYGYGFVQGADAAAAELGVEVEIKYWYSGTFLANDDIKVKMTGWYAEGTEVVFACGGPIYLSACAAAEEAGGKVIGVDSDQYYVSEVILTSAMKGIQNSVVLALTDLYDNGGVWPEAYAGKTATLGAAEDCVGLPTADTSWRFADYTVEQYEALFEMVKSGAAEISAAIDVEPAVTNSSVDYME
jgi:basic membrane protein A